MIGTNLSYGQVNNTVPFQYKNNNVTENSPLNTPVQEQNINGVKKDDIKFPVGLNEVRNSGAPVGSDPAKSSNIVNIQSDISKSVTGQPGELQQKRESLEKLGIKWGNKGSGLSEQEEMKLMQNLENVAGKIPADKRPNISIDLKERDPARANGGYNHAKEKEIELFAQNPSTGEKLDEKTLSGNLIHEYGHAVDANWNEKKFNQTQDMADRFVGVKDSSGRDLMERADNLETRAKAKGFKPDEGKEFTQDAPAGHYEYTESLNKKIQSGKLSEDKAITLANAKWDDLSKKENSNYIYDKYDPYVASLSYDKDGKHFEKYARASKQEYFAETFKAYAAEPEAFREKMANMEGYLKTHKEGTDEYKYVKDSLGIMKDSYNFFKNNVFSGHEF